MSLRIIKAGILDTLQDEGRYGHQYLGINPGGAMDQFSARLANALLGKELNEPVIEMHFPASQIQFSEQTVICICGAHFSPTINNVEIPLNHPILVPEDSVLQFQKLQAGARCYLAFLHKFELNVWLNSYSTNTKTGSGGYKGRAFERYDHIIFRGKISLPKTTSFKVLHWTTNDTVPIKNEVEFILGSEWHWLSKETQIIFQESWFQIGNDSDRMGFRLRGKELWTKNAGQLVSSAVSFGTVQLLPNGQLIILMADHQTTGGYPRIAHVTSAHLPILSQKKANDALKFVMTDLKSAEEKIIKQERYLNEIQMACKFRMENFLNGGS